MSASIYWKQVKPVKSHSLNVGAPSNFLEILEKVFGSRNPQLDESNIEALKGMAAVYNIYGGVNPYEELIEAIEQYKEIELWAEY